MPLIKALLLLLTAGLIWQFVLVVVLVAHEQRTLRLSRSATRSGFVPREARGVAASAARVWLITIPLILLFTVGALLPAVGVPKDRDFGQFLESDAGHTFLHGAWGWFAVLVVLWIFNTVLGEELLFRGVLLPRMKRAFGRRDWIANGVLFAFYHLHLPWLIPANLIDMFAVSYPARRYQSALDRDRRSQRSDGVVRIHRPHARRVDSAGGAKIKGRRLAAPAL